MRLIVTGLLRRPERALRSREFCETGGTSLGSLGAPTTKVCCTNFRDLDGLFTSSFRATTFSMSLMQDGLVTLTIWRFGLSTIVSSSLRSSTLWLKWSALLIFTDESVMRYFILGWSSLELSSYKTYFLFNSSFDGSSSGISSSFIDSASPFRTSLKTLAVSLHFLLIDAAMIMDDTHKWQMSLGSGSDEEIYK